ncbi:MAG: hypothetical protein KDB82_17795, partial [Planctomycetes bacterium]|nr:hypothetical protein [Planctomycetota bacterium]
MAVTRSLLCLLAGLSLFGGALCAQQVPTADEMAFIYELNRARNDPQRYDTENMTTYMGGTYSGVLNGVSPQPPLALNENLVQSARFHSDEMASVGYFAHQSAVNGDYANDMARNAGYPLNSGLPNGTNNIESLAANGTSGSTISYAPNDALRNLLIDAGTSPPGHRIHLLAMNSFNQNFREVGTGYAVGNGWTAGVNAAAYWAIHTGYRNTNPVRMFGVVYDDANANGRYDSGEGLSGVTIDATGPSTLQTTSNARGAWVLDVSAGTWSVTCGGGSFSGTATAGVTVGSDNVEVDFASGRSAGERDFEFQSVGGGPVLTVSANSLVFNAPTAATPSAEQSYDVSGVRLVSNVTITAPSEFQISTTSGSNWTTSLILTPSSGTLATTTIYVRFNPSGASGAIGDVTNTADGALDQLVNVVGTVSTNPAVFASPGTLNLTAARLNAASPEQSYTVSGYNLSGNLDVAATGDFQVSLTSG